jgi:hypothetical protein
MRPYLLQGHTSYNEAILPTKPHPLQCGHTSYDEATPPIIRPHLLILLKQFIMYIMKIYKPTKAIFIQTTTGGIQEKEESCDKHVQDTHVLNFQIINKSITLTRQKHKKTRILSAAFPRFLSRFNYTSTFMPSNNLPFHSLM